MNGITSWIGSQFGSFYGRLIGAPRSAPSPPPPAATRADPALVSMLVEKIRQMASAGWTGFTTWDGNFTDETPEIRKYYREMLRDPFVKAGVKSKLLAVATLDITVPPRVKGDPLAQEQADLLAECVESLPEGLFTIVWESLLPALLFGHSVAEPVFWPSPVGRWKGKAVLKRYKGKDSETYILVVDEFRNVKGVQATAYGAGETYDVSQFVIVSYDSVFGAPTGTSDLRAAVRGFIKLDILTRLELLFADKYSGPFLVGKYSNENKIASLAAAFAKARGEGFLLMDSLDDVKVLNLMPSGGSGFPEMMETARQEIAISLTGAFLQMLQGTTPGGAGNSTTHGGIAELYQWQLRKLATSIINHQLSPMTMRLNYGEGVDPPRAQLEAVNVAELKQQLEIDMGLNELVPLSKEDTYERYQRTPPRSPEDTIPVKAVASAVLPALPGVGRQSGSGAEFADGREPAVPAAPLPPQLPAKGGDAALVGADGTKVRDLLRASQSEGVRRMADVARSAVKRLLTAGPAKAQRAKRLFTDTEMTDLADALADAVGTADLLGRARIRERAAMAREAGRSVKFSDVPTSFVMFADTALKPLPPRQALDYFLSLYPDLGVDPQRWGAQVERRAFTMAAPIDATLLARVQGLIGDALRDGDTAGPVPGMIDRLLTDAGVTPDNPQYAEMVFRTNTMDSYNTGAARQLASPAMREAFPVWQYLGISDGRQGEDHEPHFDLYYPSHRLFSDVRGDRIFNCRCTMAPIDAAEWADLLASGVTAEEF